MAHQQARKFEDTPAARVQTPLLVGLVGPSGSGKTFSALRLATGIQRISGGDIYAIDTEARRMLHYADTFKFRHLPFAAPFSPLDYLAAIEHCVKKGAKTIIIDSTSHEHEGPGGVLEEHESETDRLSALWKVSREQAQLSAWASPKAKRRALINAITQMEINFVFCFRAKRKIRIIPGKKPETRGWMPIAGEEFIYEMALKCLLYPASDGVPTWNPKEADEKEMVKLPGQFRSIFAKPAPLSEDIGEQLARWAKGETVGSAIAPMPGRDENLTKDRDGWIGYWARKDVTVDRILAVLGRESVEAMERPDLQKLTAIDREIKSKKKTVTEAFPLIEESAPPSDGEPAEDVGDEPSPDEMAS
jgi:ABC-type dipeptide/oligopeptide/nickel transport system ATPase subunit